MAQDKNWLQCMLEKCGDPDRLLEWIGLGVVASMTVDAEDADERTVTLQLQDAEGNALAVQRSLWLWLSDTEAAAVTADAPDGAVTATTGTILQSHTAKVSMDVLTDASGVFVLSITESAGDSWWVNVRNPDGSISSLEVTFAV